VLVAYAWLAKIDLAILIDDDLDLPTSSKDATNKQTKRQRISPKK